MHEPLRHASKLLFAAYLDLCEETRFSYGAVETASTISAVLEVVTVTVASMSALSDFYNHPVDGL